MLEILSCDTDISFVGCVFNDNVAKSIASTLYIVESDSVIIQNSVFTNLLVHPENKYLNGNFLQVIAGSNVSLINSTITNGLGQDGGAIYMAVDSIL